MSIKRFTHKLFIILTLILASSCSDEEKLSGIKEPILENINQQDLIFTQNQINLGSSINLANSLAPNNVDHLELNIDKKLRCKNTLTDLKFSKNKRYISSPIILDDKIFLIDYNFNLHAFDANNSKRIFEAKLAPRSKKSNFITPKIGFSNSPNHQDKLFINTSSNQIIAVNSNNGQILWQNDQLNTLVQGAPIADDQNVYFITNDNKFYALNIQNGSINYTISAIKKHSAIKGSAKPLIYQDLVIAAFSSGEIYLFDKNQDSLVNYYNLQYQDLAIKDNKLTDIDANLVIEDDILYITSNSAPMTALNIKNPRNIKAIWRVNINGLSNFHLSGNTIFTIDNNNKLNAIDKKTGEIFYQKDLEGLINPEKEYFANLIVASNKILAFTSKGKIHILDTKDGTQIAKKSLRGKLQDFPILIDGKIYSQIKTRFASKLSICR